MVRLPAEIDATNVEGISEELSSALAVGVITVATDMTATAFCDSTAVPALAKARKQAIANNVQLRLVVTWPLCCAYSS